MKNNSNGVFESKLFPRTMIEPVHSLGDLIISDGGEDEFLGEVLTDESVGVLVRPRSQEE